MAKILIVDDEWLTRTEIEGMVTDLGYEVVGQAETGEEAVRMALDLKPDLILMDVVIPGGMNGIEAAETIKAESDIAIVFISGYGDPDYVEKAKKIEPYGYVMKPFDKMEISAFIEIALHKKEMESKLKDANERLKQTNLELEKKIEEQKKTRKKLEENERHLAKAQKVAHLGNWYWDIKTNTISWSDELYRIHGLPPQAFEANYDAYLERVHPEDLTLFKGLTKKVLKDKKPYSAQYRIVRADNETRIIHEQGEVALDADGNPISNSRWLLKGALAL